MEQFTFEEKAVLASAVSIRIRDLSKTINDCLPLGIDVRNLCEVRASLFLVYKKLTGVDYSVNH